MPDQSQSDLSFSGPRIDQLFERWQVSLNSGVVLTATQAAGDSPELAEELQTRINEHFSLSAAQFDETITNFVTAPAETPADPAFVGYEIQEVLGKGGMGVVYKAKDRLGRQCALKIIRRDRASANSTARFFDEALCQGKLSHPNLVPILHYGDEGGLPYFVMELHEKSMDRMMADLRKDPIAAAGLFVQIARGVGHLHRHGYIHRDLKPQNVLITADGAARVSDLGLAKQFTQKDSQDSRDTAPAINDLSDTKESGASRSRTVVGTVLGTKRYMAPEQAAGQVQLACPQWDVWSLGVMLWEIFVGKLPPSCARPDKMLDPATPNNPAPSEVLPAIDRGLELILQRSLARRPADRYPHADALADDLERWLQQRTQPKPRPKKTRMLVVIVAATVVIGLVLYAAFGGFRNNVADKTTDSETAEQRMMKARDRLVEKLKRGETVQLIGDSGVPDYYVARGTRAGTRPFEDRKQFTIAIQDEVLIELIPDGACPQGFELSARLQNEKYMSGNARTGLYFGHNPAGDPDGPDHTFAELGFMEYATAPKPDTPGQFGGYSVRMHHHVNPDLNRKGLPHAQLEIRPFPLPPKKPVGNPYPEQHLKITVLPESVTTHWLGDPPSSEDVPSSKMMGPWNIMTQKKLPRASFGSNGGAGIYVKNGTVSVRQVEVRPLK